MSLDLGWESLSSGITTARVRVCSNMRKDPSSSYSEAGQQVPERGPRIALLTPYSGNNLGDAAIQDAMIANIRLRLPGAQFSGITLNCDNFVGQHGVGAFSLHIRRYVTPPKVADQPGGGDCATGKSGQKISRATRLKRAIKRAPVVGWCRKTIRAWGKALWRESCHCIEGCRFLRTQDFLVVSGGGQIDDEWGGAWHHPFALFKWAILAWINHIPYVIASVGAGKVTSTTSRFFLSATLRMARYRSYRDKNSREIAAGLLPRGAGDSVVPDLAFSLPSSMLPLPAGIRAMAQGRRVVAISPMAYARPGSWPYADHALYDRYLQQMGRVVSKLLDRGYFLVMVCSALTDASVIPELLGCLDPESKKRFARQMLVPAIATWKDLVALLLDVDFLIASRLHSAILGFVSQRPTIAISFDPKVDWVMEDLGQTEYLLQILDFTAEDVIAALDRLEIQRSLVMEQIGSYRDRILPVAALQYDTLAELATASRRRHN